MHVQAMIEEMRTGKPYELPQEGITRSKLAAGPTTLEDLVDPLPATPSPSLLPRTQCGVLLSIVEVLHSLACQFVIPPPGNTAWQV